MRALLSRIAALFRRRRLDGELNDEVGFHLAMLEDVHRARGLDARAARLAARREFGGVAQTQEAYRERRGVPWLEDSARDVRYAARGLRRNPGFTAAAVLSLALGIGANTTIFSLFYSLMVRRLPVSSPDELLSLRPSDTRFVQVSYPLYREIAARTDLFAGVIARNSGGRAGFGKTDFIAAERVSGNYFDVLGVQPAAGRLFTEYDNRPGTRVAVLAYDYWQRAFGGNPGVVGRTVDGRQVIGVAAPGFRGIELGRCPDEWLPIEYLNEFANEHIMGFAELVVRRRRGVPVAQVESALTVLLNRYNRQIHSDPSDAYRPKALKQRFEVRQAGVGLSQVREQFGKPLTVLMATVGLLLLAACANVASLVAARGQVRWRETALRFSLGATRARVVRQALTESALIAALGCALGAAMALWGRWYMLSFLPPDLGDSFGSPLDRWVLAFTAGVAALAAVLSGLGPALRFTAVAPAAALRGEPERGGRRRGLRSSLVVAQVAFSVVLALAAALFGTSLAQLRAADPGFANRKVIAITMVLNSRAGQAAQGAFVAKLGAMPGVASVATSQFWPYAARESISTPREVRVPGSERTAQAPAPVEQQDVSDRYFETLGSPLVQGREFSRAEANSERRHEMAIVNQEFVREFMPGGGPRASSAWRETSPTKGCVSGRSLVFLLLEQRPEPIVYRPAPYGDGFCILVAAQHPEALLPGLRREVARLASFGFVREPQTLERQIDESIYEDRLLATVSGCFGVLALLLAAVGLYGVVAYGAAQRSHEIGVRLALGAEPRGVLWMVLRGALWLVAMGLAIGLPAAFVAARAAGAIVFGVRPQDLRLYAATTFALLAAGAMAALLPARRAAAMDPMQALRHE